MGSLEAVAPEAGHVQEHIRETVIRDDEAEAFGNVEPLDPTGHLDDLDVGSGAIGIGPGASRLESVNSACPRRGQTVLVRHCAPPESRR
jgi:hypothetical protein